ncbi:MAG TPA: dicarboxylate/amino acid:cation symporter [Bacillota bacterium]|nr:dicarboxylate/amino acid:cation symporter [Bacillota bacterium]
MKKWWTIYRDTSFMLKMSIGFIAGIIIGLIVGPSIAVIEPLGTIFLNLLQLIVVPIILLTLIGALNNIRPSSLGKIGLKIFVYYILTTAIATFVGLVIASWISPGINLSLPDESVSVPDQPSITDVILNIFPSNIFQAFIDSNILAIVFVALVIGFILSYMAESEDTLTAERGDMVFKLVGALEDVTFRFLNGVLQYAPIGILALIATTVGEQSFSTLGALGKLIIAVYGSVFVQILFVYASLLLLFHIKPFQFLKKIHLPISTAFFTQSSTGTLPITLKSADIPEINESVGRFTLPIGATVNMDGAAIRLGASVVFAANIIGLDLSFTTLLGIVVTATLISIGTAGVPGAGIVALSVVLTQFDLPMEAVALVAGIDVILGMAATACNVTGDMVGAAIVSQSENKKKNVQAK